MRKILVFLLLGLSLSAYGQRQSLSLSLSPVDLGVGLRYDRYIKDAGIYISGTYGNYRLSYGYIHDHVKISSGLVIKLPCQEYVTYMSIGICGHHYGNRLISQDYNTSRVLLPVSYEIGVGASRGRFIAGFRIDPYKWDSAIDIGIKF